MQERVTMRKIREILRLSLACKQSRKLVARSCNVGKTTVTDTIARATAAGISWPLPEDMDDEALERLLYPPSPNATLRKSILPAWNHVRHELVTHDNLTLMLLWQEYKERNPDGYQYSQYCLLYRHWRKRLDLSMRQEHRAGEKMFIDYCGQTLPVVDPMSWEIHGAQVFVAVLGASSYTYSEATWTQQLHDWINSHVRAFIFFKGVTQVLVPDNIKSGVTKPCYFDPVLNVTYAEMAAHYKTAIIPARPGKAKDKAKAEAGVKIAQSFILAGLRHRTFFSLAEANVAIRERLEILNNRPFRKMPGSRKQRYEEVDRPALITLPAQHYQFADWEKERVGRDYHIEVTHHYYSVPYKLVGEQVDVRYTSTTVECFHKSIRVASHARSNVIGGRTTNPEHMPRAHREYAEWTAERFISWSGEIGKSCAKVVDDILSQRIHPEQALRFCKGLRSLSRRFGCDRLEVACTRALHIKGVSYRSIKSILEHNLDKKPLESNQAPSPEPHENLRGGDYYN